MLLLLVGSVRSRVYRQYKEEGFGGRWTYWRRRTESKPFRVEVAGC